MRNVHQKRCGYQKFSGKASQTADHLLSFLASSLKVSCCFCNIISIDVFHNMAEESSTECKSQLSELFDSSMKIIHELDVTDFESNSPGYQVRCHVLFVL